MVCVWNVTVIISLYLQGNSNDWVWQKYVDFQVHLSDKGDILPEYVLHPYLIALSMLY